MKPPVFIAAGGKSSRMGAEKALVDHAGRPHLSVLVERFQTLGHATRVVADRRKRYTELGIDCLVDEIACSGPMSALLAAMHYRVQTWGEGWLLFVGCDQWWWEPRWTVALEKLAQAEVEAVCFALEVATSASMLQPIPACYHSRLAMSLQIGLESGERSLKGFLTLPERRVARIDTEDNPGEWSFNDPFELRRVKERMEASGLNTDLG